MITELPATGFVAPKDVHVLGIDHINGTKTFLFDNLLFEDIPEFLLKIGNDVVFCWYNFL